MFDADRALGTIQAHRGPFTFMVSRPMKTKAGFWRSEWLPGQTDGEDVVSEALALLTDPRDTIKSVCVHSIPEQTHVYTFRTGDIQQEG